MTIEKTLNDVKEFKDLYNEGEDAKRLIDSAKRLEGVARHASMHACGVVITKEPVTEYTPLQKIIGKKEGTVTQYSSSTKSSFVEKIGLLKMDFLGLKNLTIIQNTLRIVRKTKGMEINIDDIPLDDKKSFDLLRNARTTGVFQLESSGMKRYLKQLLPNSLEDVIAMVALYRPGPMDWIPDFIARKHGQREIKYLHPKLKPILEKTYGVAVYQEQVMQIAQVLAGFSLGEADVLRKAMGKKIMKLIMEQKMKFIDGCVKNGVGERIAEKIFAYIEPFAGYGFNRSHAACYALVGYQTAYLKAHFPAEFMAALLTSDQDNIDRIAIEISECREIGLEVLPPDVNESFEEFAVISDSSGGIERIRFGLNAIKNVGHTVARAIVDERKQNGKYKNLTDLIERVNSKDLNKKSIEALAKVGALDNLAERNQILASIEKILQHIRNHQDLIGSNQNSLFGSMDISLPQIALQNVETADNKQKLSWEKEHLGLYISDHPAKEYQEFFEKNAIPLRDINSEHIGRNISIGGVITKVQKVTLKNQSTMLFVTLEDMEKAMEILVFPKVLENTASAWIEDNVIIASGKISDKDGVFKLLGDSAKIVSKEEMETFEKVLATQKANGFSDRSSGRISKIIISLPESSNNEILRKLSGFFNSYPAGKTMVFLDIKGKSLETPYRLECSNNIRNDIERSFSEVKVRLVNETQ